jgi:streptogrisin D
MLTARSRVRLATVSAAACAALGLAPWSASASPAARASAGAGVHGQMPAQALARRQMPLLDAAHQIIQLTQLGTAPGYSGYGDVTISVPARLVTLYWKGRLPSGLRDRLSRLRAEAPVRVVAAPYSWQQLEAQTHRISAHRAGLRAAGIALSRVGPQPDATGVLAGIDYSVSPALAAVRARSGSAAAQAAVAQAAVRHLVPGPAPVTIMDVPRPTTTATVNRNNDNSPFWGGSRIVRPGNVVCTTGFSIQNSAGARFLLTAGHCGGISSSWQTGDVYGSFSDNFVGTEVNRDSGGDTAIISVPSNQGFIYDKGWNSTVGNHVVGARSSVAGQQLICTEGATSGARCNGGVIATGLDFPMPNGETAHNEVYAQQTNGQQISAGGDSGGPVIFNTATPGNVLATGTITAGNIQVNCSGTDPNLIKPPPCFSDVYYEDINAALSHWRASLSP